MTDPFAAPAPGTAPVVGHAHGKVILLGEHAVVYGHPALCGALRDGVTVEAVPGAGALRVPQWGVTTHDVAVLLGADPPQERGAPSPLPLDAPLSSAYRAILHELQPDLAAKSQDAAAALRYDLLVRFAIPQSSGLGSSAALAVGLARALDLLLGLELPPERIAAAAFASERVFHGSPSGLDHTVAQQGGFGVFRRQTGLIDVPAAALRLCIGHTGRARDTRGRVARVAELVRERPDRSAAALAEIAALVEAGTAAVRAGRLAELGAAMSRNQELLRELDVSCPEIDHLCDLARGAGALGAKLTGGGGGGCVIALARPGDPVAEAQVLSAWTDAGFRAFVTTVGGCA